MFNFEITSGNEASLLGKPLEMDNIAQTGASHRRHVRKEVQEESWFWLSSG